MKGRGRKVPLKSTTEMDESKDETPEEDEKSKESGVQRGSKKQT